MTRIPWDRWSGRAPDESTPSHGRRQRHPGLLQRRRPVRDPEAAVAHGRRLLADGADILDIGGESTRPGATRPLVAEELARVVPVITELAAAGAVVSVDTMRAEVAEAALAAGATIVNDVSGGLADPDMLRRRGRRRRRRTSPCTGGRTATG